MVAVLSPVSVFALLVVLAAASEDLDVVSVQEPDNHLHDVTKLHSTTEIIKQMVAKRCSHQYSVPCMKLDLARLVDRLSASGATYQLLPGVSVSSPVNHSHPHPRADDLPLELAQALARDSRSHHPLDDFLAGKLAKYLGSLTLNVKLAEPVDYFTTSRALSTKGVNTEEGRKGGRRPWGPMLAAGLFSGGTLLALALAALSALAGKALMTALLSLLLSALAAMRGGGGGDSGGKTTYEIITKPVVSHEHSHSSEVQHGHHHGYGRSLDMTASKEHDAHPIVYRAHNPSLTLQKPMVLERQ